MIRQVAVNVRALSRPTTGVERYTQGLLSRLKDRVRLLAPNRPLSGAAGHLWEQARLPALLCKDELLWSPANTGPLSVASQVLSLHDASFIDHPEWFNPGFAAWYRFLLPRLLRRVPLVLTGSTFSKIRILEGFRISEGRVKIIPAGVDPAVFRPAEAVEQASVRAKFGLHKPFVLAVGSLNQRKNLGRLLEAWKLAGPGLEDADLVLVGGEGEAFRKVHFDPLPRNVRFTGRVGDSDLAALYSAAAVYVMPSLYEGFGLTLLEAMACGVPVVAANAGALPEVVEEAGILIDPFQVEEIAGAILKVVEDSALRAALVQRGFERARGYTWERTAENIWTSIIEVDPYKELRLSSAYDR
jgi:glycosyltransferase involved in cell wall biosynthesis